MDWVDHRVAAWLIPVVFWILLSGLDDLYISFVFLFCRAPRISWPSDAALAAAPERRIAIFVPLWHEHKVIGEMLAHNIAGIRYSQYDLFIGVYPNDLATIRAVTAAARRHTRIHVARVPHNGPTSKGDCLNWIYRRMREFEESHNVRFEILVTHDAEDWIHPESLSLISWFSREHEMVQIPVLPLPTHPADVTHGLYCDEFAEYQCKDIPVRQWLGGFLPANGVGTGFDRSAMERLARSRGGLMFDPDCLTEDYETGFLLHAQGCRQIFLPLRLDGARLVATREYFPRKFRAAIRQRSRWVTGIALQGWQHHGWKVPLRQVYWFWRDRKGLVGNLLSPLANFFCLYGTASFLWSATMGVGWHLGNYIPTWLTETCWATLVISVFQGALRIRASARIYGRGFAAAVPVRILWGNVVNCAATIAALRQYVEARLRGHGLAWRKTDHAYPVPEFREAISEATRFQGLDDRSSL